ncbi:MAG: TPM domain-containing protein [Rhodocyclaceae bacterium]|nr:TPM domain-containing protein [Rhodocyclaceae bacterium]
MDFARLFKHLMIPGWWARRAFRAADRAAIHEAIAASERLHRGELCLVVEGPMPLRVSLRGTSARGRAEQLFSRFGVGGTREASGILIYVQLVDRRVEILADRGIAGRVAQAEWDRICRDAVSRPVPGGAGVREAIDRATRLLSLHFPPAR